MDSKEGIDALFLFASEGIIVANEIGEITRVNPSAERLFGYQKEELLGKKIEILMPKRVTHKHVDLREKYNHAPDPRTMGAGRELYALKKDGSEFPIEISLSPYSNSFGKYVIAL